MGGKRRKSSSLIRSLGRRLRRRCFGAEPATDGNRAPLLQDEADATSTPRFDFVFVMPMPDSITEEDEARFKKKFLTEGKTYADVLKHMAISPKLRPQIQFETCNNLKEATSHAAEILLTLLESLGSSLAGEVEVVKFGSEDGTQLFICARMNDIVAEALADLCSYPVELSVDALESLHIKISDRRSLVLAYVNYGSYMMTGRWLLNYGQTHAEESGVSSFLRPVDRTRLLYHKVTDYLDIAEMMRTGLLLHAFPVHHTGTVRLLRRRWANLTSICSLSQPYDEIRNYFGEGIAFYFLFLGFLVESLLVLLLPSVCCSLAWLYGYADIAQLLFCCCVLVWSTGLVKYWRRRESFYANKWGTSMHGLVSMVKDPVNPRFHGELRPSPLDENLMELQPEKWRVILGYVLSAVISTTFTCLVAASIGLNQKVAADMDQDGYSMATEIAAVMLSVQIQFWDKLWDYGLVQMVNDLEQHVTEYAADQSRVAKTFVIKFFNAFLAFFYMGYLQPTWDPKGCMGSCEDYLRLNLLIVFGMYITFGIMDMALPYAMFKGSLWLEERKASKAGREVFEVSFLEAQSKMSPYSGKDERDDYLSSVCPIAFVMLFGTVMPTMVCLALLALASQIRTHAWKLVRALRRTFPHPTSGIGVWDKILTVLSYLSILNSIGLLIVQVPSTGNFFPGFRSFAASIGIPADSIPARTILFFILQNVALGCKLIFDAIVPDMTAETKLERSRAMLQRARMAERKHEKHEDVRLTGAAGTSTMELARLPCLAPGHAVYEPIPT